MPWSTPSNKTILALRRRANRCKAFDAFHDSCRIACPEPSLPIVRRSSSKHRTRDLGSMVNVKRSDQLRSGQSDNTLGGQRAVDRRQAGIGAGPDPHTAHGSRDFWHRAEDELFALGELAPYRFKCRQDNAILKIALNGVNRSTDLGFLVWKSLRPGDVVLWWLMPPLSCALIAVAFLLYQFFRSTDHRARTAGLPLDLATPGKRAANALKTRFVSMVSHELRTPLATIRSAADLLGPL